MTQLRNAPGYEEDFVAWLEDQIGRARRGEIDGLDLENIAEELEGMARSDRRAKLAPEGLRVKRYGPPLTMVGVGRLVGTFEPALVNMAILDNGGRQR